MKYSIDQLNTFLNLLRKYNTIFNYSIPEHKDKIKLGAAYEELRTEVIQAGIPVEDIKKEVKNVIDTYRKERKKVIQAEKSGIPTDQLYQPRLAWYCTADAFLKPVIKIRTQIDDGLRETTQKMDRYIIHEDEETKKTRRLDMEMHELEGKIRKTIHDLQNFPGIVSGAVAPLSFKRPQGKRRSFKEQPVKTFFKKKK